MTHLRRDFSGEQKAMSRNRSNELLILACFADGASRRIDPAIQGSVRNYPPFPDVLDQLVLADNAIRISREVTKKVKDLRLHMDRTRHAFKLAPVGVYREIVEIYQQLRRPCNNQETPSGYLNEITGESKAKNRCI